MSRKRDGEFVPMPEGMQVEHLGDGLALFSFPLPAPELPESLSAAERDVALQVYAGASNKEIAAARGVSPKTIGNQLDSIYRKLGVVARAELVMLLRAK